MPVHERRGCDQGIPFRDLGISFSRSGFAQFGHNMGIGVDLSQDPQHNPVLAMAFAGKTHYLVTGDRRGLLSPRPIGTTRIVTAAERLKILKRKR
ncbi:MAG: hypothetical protein ACYDDA_13310 [Acidiferrobacteraceae bacterium]